MTTSNNEVSFTKQIKEEISLLECENTLENKALLCGFLKINGHLVLRNNQWIIVTRSENIKTAKLILKLIKNIYGIEARIAVTEKKRLKVNKDNKVIVIEFEDTDRKVLKDLQLYSDDKGFFVIPKFVNTSDLRKPFIRGCFLASGSVNSPFTNNYHLEITTTDESFANFLIKVIGKFDLQAKLIQRRAQVVVYIKKSDQIADFLKVIGANKGLYYFEDIRIQRDQYNSINRLNNCEISNERKSMELGNKQADEIRWYKDHIGINNLPQNLRVIAQVRLANPDGNYNELADDCLSTFNLKITKAGIAYRMNNLLTTIRAVRGDRDD